MPQGVNTSGSPAEDQDEELDDVGGQADENQPESSTGNDDQNTDSSSEREGQQGDADDAKKTTPLDKLRGQLTKAEAPADAEGDAEEEEEADEAEPDTKAKPKAKADDKGESEDAEVDETEGDESEGDEPNDEDEKAPDFLKKLPKEQRDEVGRHFSKQLKARVEKKIEKHPLVQAGRFIEGMRTKHGLDPEEVVASLSLSAAYKAGDPRAVEALESHADALRAELKMPARVPEPEAIEPFTGALPQEFADMVSVLGMDEKDVRFLAAALKKHKEPPAKKAAPPAQEPRQERQNQPPVQKRQELTVAGFHRDDAAAADDAVVDFLVSKGVKQADVKAFWAKLLPYVEKNAPVNPQTGKPDVQFIDPERRVKAVQIAHQRYVIAQAKDLAEQKRKAGPGTTGSAPSVRTGSSSDGAAKNPLAALRKQLVRR